MEESTTRPQPQRGETWRHYKGGTAEILWVSTPGGPTEGIDAMGMATHAPTGKIVVVHFNSLEPERCWLPVDEGAYRSEPFVIYMDEGDSGNIWWALPLDEFMEVVPGMGWRFERMGDG